MCTGETAAMCGDGRLAQGEGCDDGNTAAGDGCSLNCAVEEGFKCATPPAGGSQQCKWVGGCGDGKRTNGEECDDGNTVRKDPLWPRKGGDAQQFMTIG